MSLILAWVAFPLVLVAVGAGWGVIVERAAGMRLKDALLLPLGLAAALVLAGTVTAFAASAPAAVPVVAAGAVAGLVFAWPGRRLGVLAAARRGGCHSRLRRARAPLGAGDLHGLHQARRHRDLVQRDRPRHVTCALGERRTAVHLLTRLYRRRRCELPARGLHAARCGARPRGRRHRMGLPALPGLLRGRRGVVPVCADGADGSLGSDQGAVGVPRLPSRRCSTGTACGAGSRS